MNHSDAQILKRVSDLFDEWQDMDSDARALRLAQLRMDAPDVAAELALWLQKDDATEGLLDVLMQKSADPIERSLPNLPDRIGHRVGPYRLIRLVGRGGMGEVYEATRSSADFDQHVAIKLLRRGLDSADIVQRFLRERRILAQLEHPGIARMIDGGVSDDGLPFLVMEFVEGRNLIEAANADQIDVSTRLNIFLKICDAVAYAQRRLIVHRDLKPSNILLSNDGHPKLLDFGIAKLLDDDGDEHLTSTGMRVLTPSYAAPEQILGQPISTATDVYALGVILYELLTGVLPHTRHGKPIDRVSRDVDQETMLKPSVAVLGSEESSSGASRQRLARQLSGDIDTIILHALKREPERRYQGAAELADDIRRHLQGHPVRAEVDTATYRLRKFVRRHRGGVLAAALAFVGIVAGLVVALWQAGIALQQTELARAEADRAEQAARSSTEAAQRTRKVKNFMMGIFSSEDPMRSGKTTPLSLADAFNDAVRRIDTDVADDPLLQVDLLDDFGEVRFNQGRFEEAGAMLDRALTLAEKNYSPDDPVIAETLLNQSGVAYSMGTIEQAAAYAERAEAILRTHQSDMPMQYAAALGTLATIRNSQDRSDEALQLISQSLVLTRQHHEPGTDQLISALHNQASILLALGRHDEAEPFAREAVLEAEKLWGDEAPRLGVVLNVLANIVYRQGKVDETLSVAQRGLVIMQKAFPAGHPDLAHALMEYGWQTRKVRPEVAEKYFDQSIGMFKAFQDLNVMQALRYRALLFSSLRRFDAALADLDEALQVCLEKAPEQIFCQVLRTNRAGVLARLNRGDEALRESDAVIAELTRRGALGDNEYAQALESRATALNALDRRPEASAAQQAAIVLYVKIFGEDHEDVLRARKNLAKIQR